MASNVEKLVGLFGGEDPAKKPSITEDILSEALQDFKKARRDEALNRARDVIKKAVELREQKHKLDQEYNKQSKKFEDELGKLLSQLRTSVEQSVSDTVAEKTE